MAVAIRLRKFGTKKKPHFRICVIDSRKAREGRLIEEVGNYNPAKNPPFVTVNKERIGYWIGVGATPSPTVTAILKKEGLITASGLKALRKAKTSPPASSGPASG